MAALPVAAEEWIPPIAGEMSAKQTKGAHVRQDPTINDIFAALGMKVS